MEEDKGKKEFQEWSKSLLKDHYRREGDRIGQISNKPPQGIIPRSVMEQIRWGDLGATIIRYASAGYKILPEWIEEYNELTERVSKKIKE